MSSAGAEFISLVGGYRVEFDRPDDYGATADVVPLHEAVVGDVEPALLVLQATAVFILLVAGANVAHLLLVGLLSALFTLGRDPHALLRQSPGGGEPPGTVRGRAVLVAAEVALAVVLLVGAGLMVQTMWRLSSVEPGFRAGGVLTLRLHHVAEDDPAERHRAFYAEVFDRIEQVPGVLSVGAVQHLPPSGNSWGADLEIESRPLGAGDTPPWVGWRLAAHDYFEAAGVSLLEGRIFSETTDRPGSPRRCRRQRNARTTPGGR
ncbi:MAG: hypothetical protein ABGY72_12095 [bacterium]